MSACTNCGDDSAYVGSLFVECVNPGCTFYNEQYASQFKQDESLTEETLNSKSDPDETPVMPFGVWPVPD